MAFIKAATLIVLVIWCKYCPTFGSPSLQLDDGQLFANLDKIVENVNAAESSWTAGRNFPPSLSGEHLRGLVSDFDPLSDLTDEARSCNCDVTLTGDAPEEFDPRQKWKNCPSITHITNQGACKSAWAVAAAGVIADRQCVASNETVRSPMSAQHLLSCCSQCGIGCEGGWPGKAFKFYQKHGVVTGGDYDSHEGCKPFDIKPADFDGPPSNNDETPECIKRCTNKQYPKKWKKDLHFGQEVITPCCCWIRDTLEKEGPVATSMIVYEDFFTYKSGIYRHIQGKKVGYHTVRLLGWGTENGVPYWLAANSWGKGWGENGFFRILRSRPSECLFEYGFVAPVPKMKKHLDLETM